MRSRWLWLPASLLLLTVLMTGSALAAKPGYSCPATASGYQLVDRDAWWARTVAGFAAAGIVVYQEDGVTFTAEFDAWAQSFGLADGAAVEDYVRNAQWDSFDKNRNGYVCMGSLPTTPGIAPYIFRGIDDNASTPKGEWAP